MLEKKSTYKKLDEKIRELNSSRVFKKVTPKYDLSWYIKWSSSFIILIGMVLTSAGGSEPYNLFFINGIAVFIFATGIARFYFGV